VAIKSHEAERFLARPAPHIFLYLVFGTDAGLVSERARKIVSCAVDDPKDPFQLVRIGGDELANDPARLADEANTIPLFGGRRAIWIEAQGKAFVASLEPVLKTPPRDCTIVIEAGALKKDAALRTLCERERNATAIQCYPDTPRDIAQLIDAEVGAANLSIAPDAAAFLVSQLGQDRLSTRSELGKLMLYAHGAAEITLDHVAAIVCDASNLILNEAVDAAFDGGFNALDVRLRHIFAGASDYHTLLAAALRHALDLHRARRDAEEGPREGSGFASAGFRRNESFERHRRAWTRPNLGRAIDTIGEAVLGARREPKLGPTLAARALWTIAHTARSKTATR
ncbi:MAG: DNA polymerase III subunit delta, partial [Methylocella sp.]